MKHRGTVLEFDWLSMMRLIGYLLMLSGWLLVFAALLLLTGLGQRFAFVVAGLLVSLLGLGVIALRYRSLERGSE